MDDKALSLAEIITAVIDDLYTAEDTRIRSGHAGRVGVERIELELKATTAKEGGGGIRFYVLSGNYTGKSEAVSTIRVTLSASADDGKSRTFMFSENSPGSHDTGHWLETVEATVIRTEIDRLLDGVRGGELTEDQLCDRLEWLHDRVATK